MVWDGVCQLNGVGSWKDHRSGCRRKKERKKEKKGARARRTFRRDIYRCTAGSAMVQLPHPLRRVARAAEKLTARTAITRFPTTRIIILVDQANWARMREFVATITVSTATITFSCSPTCRRGSRCSVPARRRSSIAHPSQMCTFYHCPTGTNQPNNLSVGRTEMQKRPRNALQYSQRLGVCTSAGHRRVQEVSVQACTGVYASGWKGRCQNCSFPD